MKKAESIVTIQACVVIALRHSGGLKLGTPFATASMPVRAAAPEEKARRRRKGVRAATPGSMAWAGSSALRSCPSAIRIRPAAIMPPKLKMKT
jgi:hypothetical protein